MYQNIISQHFIKSLKRFQKRGRKTKYRRNCRWHRNHFDENGLVDIDNGNSVSFWAFLCSSVLFIKVISVPSSTSAHFFYIFFALFVTWLIDFTKIKFIQYSVTFVNWYCQNTVCFPFPSFNVTKKNIRLICGNVIDSLGHWRNKIRKIDFFFCFCISLCSLILSIHFSCDFFLLLKWFAISTNLQIQEFHYWFSF